LPIISTMKNELEILKRHFGSYNAVSKELGITPRRLWDLRHGDPPGKTLAKLISRLSLEVQIQELSRQSGVSQAPNGGEAV